MPWTAPRTWVAGEVVTEVMMNSNIRDNLLYLAGTAGDLSDPKLSGQVFKGSGAQALPTVVGNSGRWRYFKAFGGVITIAPAAGEALIPPGAAATSAANATYSSPNGESTGWYCDGSNWMGL
jgi:hypothetical protein